VQSGLPIAIIGAGAVGTTFAVALHQRGYRIAGVASRTPASAERCASMVECPHYSVDPVEVARAADVIFIATPDEAIQEVCRHITEEGGIKRGDIVVHFSGALGSNILDSAKQKGGYVLALHPIQSFPKGEVSVGNLVGSYFTLEGDPEALRFGERVVGDLEGTAVSISSETKPIYHAALCVACNYLVTLTDLAVKMLEAIGIKRQDALPMILPLIKGTVHNLQRVSLPDALTGPISRGDLRTLERHLGAIEKILPDYLDVYKKLGSLTAEVAKEKGSLDHDRYEELKRLFTKQDDRTPQQNP